MGKKLDALLGRTSKTSKLKPLLNLSISRLAILKNQRQVRCSQARSDVTKLLNLGHHDPALLRVEQVIKEQNMLDALVMIEGYCHLLIERLVLFDTTKECPDELKEAISSLIHASSRCGEFPELQDIRGIFASRYGKEFVARALELRNGCSVNPKMIQKLSPRLPSLENRMKVLKEIASENGITLHLDEESSVNNNEILDLNQRQNQPTPNPLANIEDDNTDNLSGEIDRDERFSESIKARKYNDVASAAHDAFKSAAYAAAAARAAVELSRFESQDPDYQGGSTPRQRNKYNGDNGSSRSKLRSESQDPDYQGGYTPRQRNIYNYDNGSSRSKLGTHPGSPASGEVEDPTDGFGFPVVNSSESEGEIMPQNHGIVHPEEFKERKNKAQLGRSPSASSLDSAGETLKETKMSSNLQDQTKPSNEIVFDKSDDEAENEQGRISWSKHHRSGVDGKSSLSINEFPNTRKTDKITGSAEEGYTPRLNIERRPISVRARRGNGR